MQESIYILSLCVNSTSSYSEFNVKGTHLGRRVQKVRIKSAKLEVGEEYLCLISNLSLKGKELYGVCIKSKKMFSLH